MEQMSIFEQPREKGACGVAPPAAPPRARREDPATSQLAAAQAGALAEDHMAKIREALGEHGSQTIYELAARTRLSHVQIARLLPYMEVFIPTSPTRSGPTGRHCRVWRIA